MHTATRTTTTTTTTKKTPHHISCVSAYVYRCRKIPGKVTEALHTWKPTGWMQPFACGLTLQCSLLRRE